MSAAPTVRFATKEDATAIHALLQQLAETTGHGDKFHSSTGEIIEFGFSGDPRFEVLLAEHEGKIVGLTLFFYNYSSWRGELGVYIQDIVVDSNARASGIGRLLTRETVRHAQKHGATHLRLSVESDNEQAIRFYERLGLIESTSERIFCADKEEFLNLAERL